MNSRMFRKDVHAIQEIPGEHKTGKKRLVKEHVDPCKNPDFDSCQEKQQHL